MPLRDPKNWARAFTLAELSERCPQEASRELETRATQVIELYLRSQHHTPQHENPNDKAMNTKTPEDSTCGEEALGLILGLEAATNVFEKYELSTLAAETRGRTIATRFELSSLACPGPEVNANVQNSSTPGFDGARKPVAGEGKSSQVQSRDQILGIEDQCPEEEEDLDGFKDSDGCTDRDNDEDGVPDIFDACPNQGGEKDPAYMGCPRDTITSK